MRSTFRLFGTRLTWVCLSPYVSQLIPERGIKCGEQGRALSARIFAVAAD